MKRHVSRITFVLTLMGVLSIAGPVDAATPVPFNGSLQGNVTITPQDPPIASLLIEGSALLNHLGQFTFSIPQTVNFATATGSGKYVFTSSVGDMLHADFMGHATPTVLNPNNFDIVEIATITGGTGRFARATGIFTIERFSTPPCSRPSVHLQGR